MNETQLIKMSRLELNKGQIPGLPGNPRQWTQADVNRLAQSLKDTPELFEARPIIAVPHDGKLVILGGNMRYCASKYNGAKEVPVFVLPEDTPAEKLKEIVIKDNGTFGAWDFDLLANQWDDLPLATWGVPAWDGEEKEAEPEAKEDDFDEETDEIHVRCKKGDIWQLGDHRLMCGDSTDLETVTKLMGGGIADISFFSPPYNTGGIGKNLTKDNGRSKYLKGDDNMNSDDYTQFLNKSIHNAMGSSRFTFCNVQLLANNKASLLDVLIENRDKFADAIVWDKTRSQPQLAANVLNSEYEFVFVFSEAATRAIGTVPFHGTLKNIVHISPGHNDYAGIHNAVFPVEFSAHFIQNFAKESVLDLFGGTGTTLVAAEQLGRRCYMMEYDPHYCDVIIARWEKLTGRQAELITT